MLFLFVAIPAGDKGAEDMRVHHPSAKLTTGSDSVQTPLTAATGDAYTGQPEHQHQELETNKGNSAYSIFAQIKYEIPP